MKIVLFILCVAILLGALHCKQANDDLKGTSTVAGTLFIRPGLNNIADSSAVPNLSLYIQQSDVSITSYLYAVTTNKNGVFEFTNLNKNKRYRITGSMDSAGIHYTLDTIIAPDNLNLSLFLRPDQLTQTGFNLYLIDTARTPLANLRLWVFSSAVVAAHNDSTGSVYSLTTDNSGHVYKLNIDMGDYFINIQDSIGTLFFKARDTVHVAPNIIVPDTLIVKTQ